MRFHTAVNKFIWQAVLGQPVTVWRTALNQKRPYLDLRDALEAVRFVLARKKMKEALYNVVTLNASVQDILDAIRRCTGALTVELTDSPIMNQLSYEIASGRFAAEGFEFRGDLDRGVENTVNLLKGAAGC
jgi:nucleoside-diphosphate-sugar epimerase